MNNAELLAVQAWLASHQSLSGVSIALGALDDAPDRQIGLISYPGQQTPNWRADYRCQIMLRGRPGGPGVGAYADANDLASKIINIVAPAQDNAVLLDMPGNHLAKVTLATRPMPLGPDEKGRWKISINIALDVSRV